MSQRQLSIFVCAALIVVFAIIGWISVQRHCATADEPDHFLSAWTTYHLHDYRIDTENPPLWKFWAVLGTQRQDLLLDQNSPAWRAVPTRLLARHAVATEAFFKTPVNDFARLLASARFNMLLLGVALGVVIAIWAYHLAGNTAAWLATTLFCLDPNFLAHAPLVKNDVAFALVWTALALVIWRVGQRANWRNVGLAVTLPGIALGSKFSGVLAPPLLALGLVCRALMPQAWQVLRWNLSSRPARLLATVAILGISVPVTFSIIWACYGFRFHATPDPAIAMNIPDIVRMDARWNLKAESGIDPSAQQLDAYRPHSSVRAALWLQRHGVLPEAFIHGFLYTQASVTMRYAFLCGQIRTAGWWYYFPAAMLFKTPLATMLAVLAGLTGALWLVVSPHTPFTDRWAALALLIPCGFYLTAAMNSHLNLGLRHVLPVYPMLFVAAGWIWTRLRRRLPGKLTTVLPVVVVASLAAETFAAFPNFIPFFNVACGGARGGLRLLGDSNLDWGQDLPALADWQRQHADQRLYLVYFGRPDPAYYGISYIDGLEATAAYITQNPGVLAISATHLQGIYLQEAEYARFRPLLRQQPITVLGGSIYLFRWPLPLPAMGAAKLPGSM